MPRFLPLLMLLCGCETAGLPPIAAPASAVPLTWYRSDAAETWEDARGGLDWALSQLGATPPEDGSAITVVDAWPEKVSFTLELDALSLLPPGRIVLDDVAAELRANPGSGDDDVGRFLMRSLHEPWRYYAATGACPTLGGWSATRPVAPVQYAVTTSQLLEGERLITAPAAAAAWGEVAFSAGEGEGSLAEGTFVVFETEVLDVMPNGQFRYAVYGADGAIEPAALGTAAGTPGKCAWCHEDSLERGTSENASAPGYLDYTAWISLRDAAQGVVEAHRSALATSVAYETPLVHEHAERLVEGFLRPDVDRVATEWGVDPGEVTAALGEGTEALEELGWAGRYLRPDVDAAAPVPGAIPTLESAREPDPEATLVPAEPGACW